MKEKEIYIDNFKERRNFFHKSFPMKIGKQRTDVISEDILLNSCPVCGYLTLEERDAFEICGICFWEDDGIDDFEENEDSGPNHMTLKEGRAIFKEAKKKLLGISNNDKILIVELKDKFLVLDNLIEQETDKTEILKLQNEITDLLMKNKIYGLEKLFSS